MNEPDSNWPEASYTQCSRNACPSPCATPPWIWPSTIIGLMAVANVVGDAPIVERANLAGIAVDLDLASLRAIAPCKRGRVVYCGVMQPEAPCRPERHPARKRRARPPVR